MASRWQRRHASDKNRKGINGGRGHTSGKSLRDGDSGTVSMPALKSSLPSWVREREEFRALAVAVDPVEVLKRPPSERARPGELAVCVRWLRDHVTILSHLPRGKLEIVARLAIARHYTAGTLVRSGSDKRFYMVLSGRVGFGTDAGLDAEVAVGLSDTAAAAAAASSASAHSPPPPLVSRSSVGSPVAVPPSATDGGGHTSSGGSCELPPVSAAVHRDRPASADAASVADPTDAALQLTKPLVLGEGASFGFFDNVCSRLRDLPATCMESGWILSLDSDEYVAATHEFEEAESSSHVDFLSSVSLFTSWSRARLMRLASVLRHCVYPPDELVTQQGEAPQHMFFIKKGVCRVSRNHVQRHSIRWPSSKREWETRQWTTVEKMDLGSLHPGMYFGEAAIFRGEPRFANVTTVTVVELLALHAKHFLHLLPENTLDRLKRRQDAYGNDLSVRRQYELLQRRYAQAQDPVNQIIRRLNASAAMKSAASAFGGGTAASANAVFSSTSSAASASGGGGGGGGGGAAAGDGGGGSGGAAAGGGGGGEGLGGGLSSLVSGAVSGFRRRRSSGGGSVAVAAAKAAVATVNSSLMASVLGDDNTGAGDTAAATPPTQGASRGDDGHTSPCSHSGSSSDGDDASGSSPSPYGMLGPPLSPIAFPRDRRGSIGEVTRLRLDSLHESVAAPSLPGPPPLPAANKPRRKSTVFPLL